MAAVPAALMVAAVEAAVRGAVSGGASRQVAAAVASAAMRSLPSLLEGKGVGEHDDDDPVLQERLDAVKASLATHRADCVALGASVHSAAVAALLVGGEGCQEKLKLHKKAGVAKHEELHLDLPLAGVRARRGG